MKILSFTFETVLSFSKPVTDHSFVLRCLPTTTPSQTVLDCQVIIAPHTTVNHQNDGFGNRLQIGRIEAEHDEFSFVSTGMTVVDIASSFASREVAHPMYSNPSTFTATNPEMRDFANQIAQKATDPWGIACLLSDAVHERLAYEQGTTDVTTTASQAFDQGRGVCQDYAHVLIALLRSRGIPSRYVNGLIVGEGATHAWVEIYDGKRWRGIDPTNARPVDDTYIVLSHGRDFSDCPIESGVFRGDAEQKQRVSVRVFDQAD